MAMKSHPTVGCFLPPYLVARLGRSQDPRQQRSARRTRRISVTARERRDTITAPSPPLAEADVQYAVHDMAESEAPLPGVLLRRDGAPSAGDAAADEAFDHAVATGDFLRTELGRNSLDGLGLPVVSSVHYGDGIANAFWNGEQMLYGDGDGVVFGRFTAALDVVAHELIHGLLQFTIPFVFVDEPGALREHFADVFGVVVRLTHTHQDYRVPEHWWMGAEICLPGQGLKGVRTFTEHLAFEGHALLGDDRQPKHYSRRFEGVEDLGGVHINSGICNHAFYRAVIDMPHPALGNAARIWYLALQRLHANSQFADAARQTYLAAGELFGDQSPEQRAVQHGWEAVGLDVAPDG